MITAITDRTQADVDALKALLKKGLAGMTAAEKTAFNAGLKGGFGWTDYNRIGESIQELSGLLSGLGYTISVTAKADWAEDEFPNEAAKAALLADLEALKSAMYGTILLPSVWNYLTYEDANNVERLLVEVEKNIYLISTSYIYCGEAYSGEF